MEKVKLDGRKCRKVKELFKYADEKQAKFYQTFVNDNQQALVKVQESLFHMLSIDYKYGGEIAAKANAFNEPILDMVQNLDKYISFLNTHFRPKNITSVVDDEGKIIYRDGKEYYKFIINNETSVHTS